MTTQPNAPCPTRTDPIRAAKTHLTNLKLRALPFGQRQKGLYRRCRGRTISSDGSMPHNVHAAHPARRLRGTARLGHSQSPVSAGRVPPFRSARQSREYRTECTDYRSGKPGSDDMNLVALLFEVARRLPDRPAVGVYDFRFCWGSISSSSQALTPPKISARFRSSFWGVCVSTAEGRAKRGATRPACYLKPRVVGCDNRKEVDLLRHVAQHVGAGSWKFNPDPVTRSRTVHDTKTSSASANAVMRAAIWTAMPLMSQRRCSTSPVWRPQRTATPSGASVSAMTEAQ